MADRAESLVLGYISGLHGVQGWVKVFSYTDPRDNILNYSPWQLNGRSLKVEHGQIQGKGLIAKLEGVDDRDAAAALMGAEITIPRESLPPLPEGEYYWADLRGLRVLNTSGRLLGVVDHLIETGANDVLVVKGERETLIPLVFGIIVLEVNLAGGSLLVAWESD
jgi:16S rRNA processing protein RimM